MLINSINQNSKINKIQLDKNQTFQKISSMPKDSFQKNSNVSNPLKTYTSTNINFNGLFNFSSEKTNAKIETLKDNAKQKYGEKALSVTFGPDKYSPKDTYCLQVELDNNEKHSEFYDKDFNKIIEEDVKYTLSGDKKKLYSVKKTVDYRNNTTSKVREEYAGGAHEILTLTDEVRIVRDKNNKIIRKELTTTSPVSGTFNQKYVYPNGTEKVISDVKKYKNFDNMECIHKDMLSAEGVRTQYKLEQDKKGNKLLEYKITDKNGNVLMNLNKTMERISDNKIISSNGNKVYEMTFEPKQITIAERNGKTSVIPINKKWSLFSKNLKLKGDKDEMMDLLKKLPAEQLMALSDTVKTLVGVDDTFLCKMSPDSKEIFTINEEFSALHEMGHAIDYRHSGMYISNWADISKDSDLRKIYTEEKDAFNKAYPNAQREHIGYFINQENHYSGKWGGLQEIVAETNALRDSYTKESNLGIRVQYLQQHYPRTIAYINDKLENYKK